MASFSFFRIYPLETGIRLSWMFEGAGLAASPVYYIERSADDGDTWTRLNPLAAIDSWVYDIESLSGSLYTSTTLYKVVADVDGSETESDPLSSFGGLDVCQAALLQSLFVQLTNRMKTPGIGTLGSLFRRRFSGETCSECVDAATGEVYDFSCSTCSGTGIVGGFFPSVSQYVEVVNLESYDRQWRSLVDNYSSDVRAIRAHFPCKWVEGDALALNGEYFFLTSKFKVEVSLLSVPLTYVGIITKVPSDHPVIDL